MKRSLIISLLITMLLGLVWSSNVTVSNAAIPADSSTVTLRELADKRGLLIGAAVAYNPFSAASKFRDLLAQEFNVIVPENVMKWEVIHPEQDKYNFASGDKMVKFAQDNKMKFRGHTLVWHNQLPGWLFAAKYTREQLLDILKTHIQTVVSHYKGQVYAWDVVNEAIDDNNQLRKSIWSEVIGPDFIEYAFRFAHEADPDAKLFYNDYNGEGMGQKAGKIYDMVKALKDKGVPIDGVGLQMHIGATQSEAPTAAAIAKNMKRINDLGLEVQITEMDVKVQNVTGSDEEKLQKQADVYATILRTCLEAKSCTALLVWGLTDQFSWIPGFTGHPDAPLLFDKKYQPKPAYDALIKVLQEAP